jgi:hypothetical protein
MTVTDAAIAELATLLNKGRDDEPLGADLRNTRSGD